MTRTLFSDIDIVLIMIDHPKKIDSLLILLVNALLENLINRF